MSGLLSHRILVVLLIGVLAAAGDACVQTTWYVDDDAAGDPGAGDPTVSDPNEDGSAAHPFDAIGEGINAAVSGDTVLVLDGTYTGAGNHNLDFGGRLITVRSVNGAAGCVIDCQAAGRGFTFHSGETAAAVVQGFTITNATEEGGGGMFNVTSSPTVTRCTFSGNTAWTGGGMFNLISSPTVIQCTFSGNVASWDGGGMANFHSSPTVTRCTFSGNTADGYGGGMCNYDRSSTTVTQCTFIGNTSANFGGGMYNTASSPTVTHCTFSGNTTDDYGGAMVNDYQSSPTVTNCILYGDTPDEIYNHDPNSVPTVTYSDVQGGYAGTGNIDDAPLFVDAPGGDLRLGSGSPCIDAGDNAAVPAGLTTDLDGNPRISHGTVDMGAYERQDDDGDGVLDGSDVCPGFDDSADADGDAVPDGCDDCPNTASGDAVDADGCSTEDDDGDGVLNDADDCPDTPTCATNIDADGCAIDSDGDGLPDGCPPAAQDCCGAAGPVAPLGLAIGMLLLSRFTGYGRARRRR